MRLDETVDEVGVMTVELHFLGDVNCCSSGTTWTSSGLIYFLLCKVPSIESKLAAFASLQGHPRLGMHDAGLSYVEDFPAGFKETLPLKPPCVDCLSPYLCFCNILTRLKSGRYMAMTMVPIMPARNIIITGSSAAVNLVTASSRSST